MASAFVGFEGGTRGAGVRVKSALAANADAREELKPKAPATPLLERIPWGRPEA